ncbi:MAG: helix-turn-helix domain-containing protein [Candidatus Staskawiczbacteria bacterium]|nr:helix-turn-helix domain-containing protein [Candidatus Staskawiczbacteria bacterium]
MEKNNFYTAEELAKELRVNIMTIYRYIKAGKVKAYKIGKEFRIDKSEFCGFLDKVKTELERIKKRQSKFYKDSVIKIKKEYNQIQGKLDKSLDLVLNGVINKDEFSKISKELQERKAELEYKLKDYESK